jgi:hypothetical protein
MEGGDMRKRLIVDRIILDVVEPNEPSAGVVWLIDEGSVVGEITVKDDHAPLNATVSWVDAEGSPATPVDVPVWSSTDESVATVEASEDGSTATISIGSPGATVIQVDTTQADGDVISATGTITVEPGEVTLGSVEFAEEATAAPPVEEVPPA